MRSASWFTAALTAVACLLAAPRLAAETVFLEEARIFIEFNDTDQDVGAHVFFDGEGWSEMKIFDPDGSKIFDLVATGSVGEIGISEMFFEGEEPTLDDLPLDEFFERFPEGWYRFVGKTAEGDNLRGKARFRHRIPGAPSIVSPHEGEVTDPDHTVIEWDAVTTPAGVVIAGYQVIVGSFQVTVSATTTSVTVPPEFLEPDQEYGFEVLSIEANGNQTISSSSFVTE